MPSLRIYAAVRPAEFDLLYDDDSQRRLAALGELVRAEDATSIELPPGLSDDYDILITSWSTAPFSGDLLRGKRLLNMLNFILKTGKMDYI